MYYKLFIPILWFHLRGNLDFLEFLQKYFITLTTDGETNPRKCFKTGFNFFSKNSASLPEFKFFSLDFEKNLCRQFYDKMFQHDLHVLPLFLVTIRWIVAKEKFFR